MKNTFLLIDLGGTKADYVVFDPTANEVQAKGRIQTANCADAAEMFHWIAEDSGLAQLPSHSVLAAPGQQGTDGVIRCANIPWTISADELKSKGVCFESITMINDLAAKAAGAVDFSLKEAEHLIRPVVQSKKRQRTVIVSVGTGLNIAELEKIQSPQGEVFHNVNTSEYGQIVPLAHPDRRFESWLSVSGLKIVRGKCSDSINRGLMEEAVVRGIGVMLRNIAYERLPRTIVLDGGVVEGLIRNNKDYRLLLTNAYERVRPGNTEAATKAISDVTRPTAVVFGPANGSLALSGLQHIARGEVTLDGRPIFQAKMGIRPNRVPGAVL